jgi:hypothetical protein
VTPRSSGNPLFSGIRRSFLIAAVGASALVLLAVVIGSAISERDGRGNHNVVTAATYETTPTNAPRAVPTVPTTKPMSEFDRKAREAMAYDVCKDFVKERLKAPGSAKFPDFYKSRDEILVIEDESIYTIKSTVDAENSFGAELRSRFRCQVRDETGGADASRVSWGLVEVTISD